MGGKRRLVAATILALYATGCGRPADAAPGGDRPPGPAGAAAPADCLCDATCLPDTGGLKPPAPGAKPVASPGMLEARSRAGSRVPDRDGPGGFAPSGNYPRDLGAAAWGAAGAVSVVAFPDEPAAWGPARGFAVRVINRTAGPVALGAIDSSLHLVQEARDAGGKWRPVERLPRTSCGNSYHRVTLGAGQYWQFPARAYDGPLRTALRFRLDRGDEPPVYSAEFAGAIDPGQFDREAREDCETCAPTLVPGRAGRDQPLDLTERPSGRPAAQAPPPREVGR